MSKPIQPTARQLAIFCYFSLTQAARDWSWVIKDSATGKVKTRMRDLHQAEKLLNDCFIKEMGSDVIASYSEDAAMWNEIMTILTTGTTEDKARFVSFLRAYTNGEVTDLRDETDKEAA